MRDTDLLRQLTALDLRRLEGGEALAYTRYLEAVLGQLLRALQARSADDPHEIRLLEAYIRRLLHTVECLQLKVLGRPDRPLRYDPTDSGFPNHIELRELEADLERREAVLRELPDGDVLREAILESVFRHHAVPEDLLRQMGQRSYHLRLSQHLQLGGLFLPFTPGELTLLDDTGGRLEREYLYHWGAWDVLTNRPHVYLLLFEQPAARPPLERDGASREALFAAARKHTVNTAPLSVLARDLDEALEDLRPKVLKRIDIGPLHGRYAEGDSVYTTLLRKHFGDGDLLLEYTTETVFSVGQETVRKGLLGAGRIRQVFFVDKADPVNLEQGLSRTERYLLATHGVVQYLNDHHAARLRELAHPPFTYLPEPHGTH